MNTYLIYLMAGGFTTLIALIGWLSVDFFKRRGLDNSYENQLNELLNSSDEDDVIDRDRGRNTIEKWDIHWRKLAKLSGLARYEPKDNPAGRDVLFMGGALFLLALGFTRNPVIAVMASVGPVFLINVYFKMRYDRLSSVIQDQLPGFLFAMKANIQANETPVRAILKVVDNMPEPLRSDLMIVKQKILANASFAESLEAMMARTNSPELRFLASCLIQAASTGANIEPQLDTIQNVLEQRRKAADELNKAVKATLPAIYIASFAIPGSFAASYFLDANAREFWFKDVLSYLVLAIVLGLWGMGMFFARRMVQNIKNL